MTGVTEDGDPVELLPHTSVMLRFTEQVGLAAHAGCEFHTAAADLGGNVIDASKLTSSTMGCRTPEHADQDAWLLDILRSGPSWQLSDETLVITASGTELTLTARPSDQLLGRTFESTSVTEDGEPKELLPDSVVFVELLINGSIDASAGCNTKSTTVELGAGRIRSRSGWTTTDGGCPSTASYAQDNWIMDFMMASPGWFLDGNTLVLTADGTEITLEDTGEPADLVGEIPRLLRSR